MAKIVFPISFDLYRNHLLLSSHSVRNEDEEKVILATANSLYPGQITQANRKEVGEAEPTDDKPENTVKNVPELADLKLATIYSDESTTLVSLTHRIVIADWDGDNPQKNIPHVHITTAEEQAAGETYFGEYNAETDGFPGWPAIFDYLEAHPELPVDDDEPDELVGEHEEDN